MSEGTIKDTIAYSKPGLTTKKSFSYLDLALLLLLVLFGFGLRFYNLEVPNKKYFDEVYYVDAAEKLWAGKLDPNSVHPPLGKWIIGIGLQTDSIGAMAQLSEPVKWRLASVVAGSLMVGLTYWLGLIIFNYNRVIAGLAALMVATEQLHIVSSRIAMLDPFIALFSLAGIVGAMKFFLDGRDRWAIFSAIMLGLATGCKWSGLFSALACFVAGFWMDRQREGRKLAWRYLLWLALLTPISFLLCYTHLFLMHGLDLNTLGEIFNQGERMVKFRQDAHQFTHRYISYFWSWPLMLQPVWFFFEENKAARSVSAICAIGTPVFWWGFLLFLTTTAISSLKSKQAYAQFCSKNLASGALIIIWLWQWLPWAISYTGGFFYYMLPEVPIMALLLGKVVADMLNLDDVLGEGRWKGWLLLSIYLLCATAYYPFAVAKSAPRSYFNKLFTSRWIVGNPKAKAKATTHRAKTSGQKERAELPFYPRCASKLRLQHLQPKPLRELPTSAEALALVHETFQYFPNCKAKKSPALLGLQSLPNPEHPARWHSLLLQSRFG